MKRRALMGAALAAPWTIPGLAGTPFAMPPAGRDLPSDFFGIHLHRLALNAGEEGPVTPWPHLPFAGLRLWDSRTLWSNLASTRGRWSFVRMDAYVAAASAHGAHLLYTLGGTPRWASARPDEPGPYGPGCAAEPADLSEWEDYVRVVARRYRGRIAAYEVWNEPHFSEIVRDRDFPGFFTGSLAVMLEMTRIARRVLDAEDPPAMLCTPGFVNGPDRLEMFLAGGGSRWVQAVDYHLYARDTKQLVDQIGQLRALMTRQGVASLPLWNTEFGAETWDAREALPPGVAATSDEQAAANLAQFMVVNAAAGVARCYYYAWDNRRSGMFDSRGQALPRLRAMAQVQSWLTGSRITAFAMSAGGESRCDLERDGQRAAIVWSGGTASQRWRPGPGWKIVRVEPLFAEPGAAPQRFALSPQPALVELAPTRDRE